LPGLNRFGQFLIVGQRDEFLPGSERAKTLTLRVTSAVCGHEIAKKSSKIVPLGAPLPSVNTQYQLRDQPTSARGSVCLILVVGNPARRSEESTLCKTGEG
jgi:hypothetical protein